MTTTHPDFEVFEAEVHTGSRGVATFLRAYTAFDRRLVAALKSQTSATFHKDASGRGFWSTASDSRYAPKFRELIAAAAARASADATAAAAARPDRREATRAALAADYDRNVNEGGEGFNPYRDL